MSNISLDDINLSLALAFLAIAVDMTARHGHEYARFVCALWNVGNAVALTCDLG